MVKGGKGTLQDSLEHRKALMVQIREAYGRVVYTYTTHLKQAGALTKKIQRIKVGQIVLSAISTTGFLGAIITNTAYMTWIGGIMSAGLLMLNLYFKDFNLVEESKRHRTTADELWIIREKYISLLTDLDILSEERVMQIRDELQNNTAEIYKVALLTNSQSYKEAQKGLKNEEEQFFTSLEIDKMLPEHLREENKK